MYEIKAKLAASRVQVSRTGSRLRRLPKIVLGTGAVLRIAPGRSVKITPEVYEANKALLDQCKEIIEVKDLRPKVDEEVIPPKPLPPEPLPIEPIEEEAVKPEPPKVEEAPSIQEDIIQEATSEVVAEEPASEKPKPKKRRSRKKKKVEPEDA